MHMEKYFSDIATLLPLYWISEAPKEKLRIICWIYLIFLFLIGWWEVF